VFAGFLGFVCASVCVCEDAPHFQYGLQDLCAKVQSLQQFNDDRVQGLQSRVFELEKMLEVSVYYYFSFLFDIQ
jgi:hypothetical protein